jgi:hypothetical protein
MWKIFPVSANMCSEGNGIYFLLIFPEVFFLPLSFRSLLSISSLISGRGFFQLALFALPVDGAARCFHTSVF